MAATRPQRRPAATERARGAPVAVRPVPRRRVRAAAPDRPAERRPRPDRRDRAPPVAEHGRLPAAPEPARPELARHGGSASRARRSGSSGCRRSTLVQVGDDYYVTDGHNRVAAARRAGALEIDADVTQLLLPGVTQPGQATLDASSLIGAAEVRQAGRGAAVAHRRAAQRERRPTRGETCSATAGRRMTDRLTLPWPDPAPFVARGGRPIRILAVSDEPDPSLDSAVTREPDRCGRHGHRRRRPGARLPVVRHRRVRRAASLRPRQPRRGLGLERDPPHAAAGADARRPRRRGERPAPARVLRLADLQRGRDAGLGARHVGARRFGARAPRSAPGRSSWSPTRRRAT